MFFCEVSLMPALLRDRSWKFVEQRLVKLLLSKPMLAEYRAVLSDAELVDRFPQLTIERVEVALRRLRYFGDYVRTVRVKFDLPRDPRDEKFIELGISRKATHIVTADDDLLSLSSGHADAARRLRQRLPEIRILTPSEFLANLQHH
jgi:putative PIN family toxin of toxin-antitoxin system